MKYGTVPYVKQPGLCWGVVEMQQTNPRSQWSQWSQWFPWFHWLQWLQSKFSTKQWMHRIAIDNAIDNVIDIAINWTLFPSASQALNLSIATHSVCDVLSNVCGEEQTELDHVSRIAGYSRPPYFGECMWACSVRTWLFRYACFPNWDTWVMNKIEIHSPVPHV